MKYKASDDVLDQTADISIPEWYEPIKTMDDEALKQLLSDLSEPELTELLGWSGAARWPQHVRTALGYAIWRGNLGAVKILTDLFDADVRGVVAQNLSSCDQFDAGIRFSSLAYCVYLGCAGAIRHLRSTDPAQCASEADCVEPAMYGFHTVFWSGGGEAVQQELRNTFMRAGASTNAESLQRCMVRPMTHDLCTLDADALQALLMTLIEAERDLGPRHVALTRMINELSVTGFPLLIEAARAILDEDRPKSQTWMSAPLRSALERVCSGVEGAGPTIERRFDTPEEDHLFDQLRALMTDLEQLLMVSDGSFLSQLRTLLWIGATRHLMARVDRERDQRLRLILIDTSDALGDLALTSERFERDASDVLAEHLRLCYAGGGELSLMLPVENDLDQIAQLKASGLATDLRGVERLRIEGYGALTWLDEVKRGLDEVRSIEALVLRDDDVEGLRERGLLDRVEAGWSAPIVVDEAAGVEFKMVHSPAGSFRWWWEWEEGSQVRHPRVELTRPFLIGQTVVTQALWEAVMGSNPSRCKGDDLPVEWVSWFDCVRFCNTLSESAGLDPVYEIGPGKEPIVKPHLNRTGYRLPTEAEWEYMAKAGTDFRPVRLDDPEEVMGKLVFQDDYSSVSITYPVAKMKPNAWGIYDHSGNVWEWCSDEYKSAYDGDTVPSRDPHEWGHSITERSCRGGPNHDYGHRSLMWERYYERATECYVCDSDLGDMNEYIEYLSYSIGLRVVRLCPTKRSTSQLK